ncbi:MAG: hypothetical protein WBE26_20260, partial [Phycisphaerae bacterium]
GVHAETRGGSTVDDLVPTRQALSRLRRADKAISGTQHSPQTVHGTHASCGGSGSYGLEAGGIDCTGYPL